MTTWEKIWLKLKYKANECADLHRDFSQLRITHEQWCKQTEQKFKARNLKRSDLDKIAAEIKLMPGVGETLKTLHSKGVKLYILSGSIKYVVRAVLGNFCEYVETVKANELKFTPQGKLEEIIGTPYDFRGKAAFIRQALEEHHANAWESLFIGNSQNDHWAHESGVATLCVNPNMTDGNDNIRWTHCIQHMKDFREVLKFVTL